MLRWPKTNPVTGVDLDSHLQIPDNANSTFHVYAPTSKKSFYYATNSNACSSCSSDQLSDNVTLDKDHNNNSVPPSPPGDETITISKVRSGTYSFSVHNYSDKATSTSSPSDNLSISGVKVKVFYNKEGTLVRKRFYVPNKNGTLWRVFTFNSSDSGSGFTRVRTMIYEDNRANVY